MTRSLLIGWMCVLVPGVLLAEDRPATDYRKPGPYEVATVKLEWRDAKRDREVPVKIYYPKEGKGPFPVLIVSHGLGGTRDGYEYLGRHWASHGYVCVHVQHHGSDDAVWKGSDKPLEAMKKAAADPTNAANRPLDVTFALDQVTKLNAADPTFKGRLDLDKVGMAGHSFGAWTTLAVIGEVFITRTDKELKAEEPRIKAAVAMSPNAPPNKEHLDKNFGGIKVPCLHLTGTKDASPIDPNVKPAERRLPFDHMTLADQYLVIFKDADHMVFSGRGRQTGGERDAFYQEQVLLATTPFWDAYLKGDARAKVFLTEGTFQKLLGDDGTFEHKAGKK